MNASRWFWSGALIVTALALTAAFLLHGANGKLRAQAAELRFKNEAVVRLAEENRHTRDLLARAARDDADSRDALHLELVRARAEAAELEQKARDAAARKLAEAAALATNRDPEKGLTQLENFKNVGRATPAAALQTIVWAALKGDDVALNAALSITGGTREKAEEILAHLPAAARASYPTPESLAAIVVTGTILDATAAQVLTTTAIDSQHAVVAVRLADSDGDEKVPMELGADGWKIVVPSKMIDRLKNQLRPPPAAPPTKAK